MQGRDNHKEMGGSGFEDAGGSNPTSKISRVIRYNSCKLALVNGKNWSFSSYFLGEKSPQVG